MDGEGVRRLEVLGPTRVVVDGSEVPLRRRELDLLAVLALRHPGSVDIDLVVDDLWPSGPPPSARASVQNHVARVRRALGTDAIVTAGRGYRLGPAWTTDRSEAEALLADAHLLSRTGSAAEAAIALHRAAALWQGEAFEDLDGHLVMAERARAAEQRRRAEDDLVVALLAAGRASDAVVEGAALVSVEPFREVRWAAYALALYRDGQRRESVRALQAGQTSLRELVGLDGGPVLRALEGMVLDDDAALLVADPATLVGRASGTGPAPPVAVTPPTDITSIGALVEMAREAHDEGRFVDAAALLGRAADIGAERWDPADRRVLGLRLHQAEALRLAGDATEVDLVWQVVHVADAAGDAVMFAEGAAALCRLGPLVESGGVRTEVAEVVERAVAGCPDPAVRARTTCQAALLYSMSGHIERAETHFRGALADARQVGHDPLLLDVLGATYPVLNHPADRALRAQLAADMLALAEDLDDEDGRFSALHLYFSIQVVEADPLLRTTFARQEASARSLRSAARRWMVGYQRACVAHLDGRLDDALAISGEINGPGAPVSRSRAESNVWMNRVVVRLAQGREQELAADIDAVLADQPGLPGWQAVAAWIAARRGDRSRVAAACAELDQGRAIPPDMTWSAATAYLGRAVARCGSADDVEALHASITPYAGLFTWYGSDTVAPFDLVIAELELARGDLAAAGAARDRAQHAIGRLRAPVFQPDLDALSTHLAAATP